MNDTVIGIMFVVLALTDSCISFYVGTRYGPNRARRLTIESLKSPEVSAELKAAWDFPTKTEVSAVRHDFDAFRDVLLNAHKNLSRDLHTALQALPAPNVTIPITSEMEDKIARSVRSAVVREVNAVLDERLKAFEQLLSGGGAGPLLDPEAQQRAIEAAEVNAFIEQLGVRYGIPPPILAVARRMGRAGVNLLIDRYNIPVAEEGG